MRLHPIMYVADQYAERDFYRLLGFEDVYEGDEFPGFLAVRSGEAIIGLQAASPTNPAYVVGLRWQFELTTVEELDSLAGICRHNSLTHQLVTEEGGSQFRTRLLMVESPSGIEVCFEGPNEAPIA